MTKHEAYVLADLLIAINDRDRHGPVGAPPVPKVHCVIWRQGRVQGINHVTRDNDCILDTDGRHGGGQL